MIVETGYSKINECVSFWAWLWHEYDEPAGCKNDPRWFRHCGSPYRRRFIRLFGFETEKTYTRG